MSAGVSVWGECLFALPSPICRWPGVCQLLLAFNSALYSARRNR
jgi:hypothetical protein